jgi:hypothetical protein
VQDQGPHHKQATVFTEIQQEVYYLLTYNYNTALVTMLGPKPSDVRGVFGYKALLELLLAQSSGGTIKAANLSETEVRN